MRYRLSSAFTCAFPTYSAKDMSGPEHRMRGDHSQLHATIRHRASPRSRCRRPTTRRVRTSAVSVPGCSATHEFSRPRPNRHIHRSKSLPLHHGVMVRLLALLSAWAGSASIRRREVGPGVTAGSGDIHRDAGGHGTAGLPLQGSGCVRPPTSLSFGKSAASVDTVILHDTPRLAGN